MKKTWDILKQAIGKSNQKSKIPQTFNINGTKISDRQRISDEFNNYFINIGHKTSQNVPKVNKHYTQYLSNPNINSMLLDIVEPNDVLEITRGFKPKISSGHDDISTKLLKDTIDIIQLPITHIINKSFQNGKMPDALKIAKVIPIYKNSETDLPKNYRPVSLLSSFSKIIEKLMYKKVFSFLNHNLILYKHQYGFRAKHSTIHPIIHLLNECSEANIKQPKEFTLSIFCDLSKAFDVIDHGILLNKMKHYGIRGMVNDWFKDYLSNRKQYTEIDNVTSNMSLIKCGVPQGSILGPLLYLIYVNDIATCTQHNIVSFADDTSLYLSHPNLQELYREANIAMSSLHTWFCANKLSLNANKTKYIVLRAQTTPCNLNGMDIYINGTKLQRVGMNMYESSTKFLGVTIDEHLTWKYHLNLLNTKISRSLFAIKQAKNILPTKSLVSLYFALIHPHLLYGILAWGKCSQNIINRTIVLQKRAIRTITKSKYNSHTDPLFKKNNILKVKDLYEYQSLIFMYDYKNCRLPISFMGTFKYNHEIQENPCTRQANQYYIHRGASGFYEKLPLFNMPSICNNWSNRLDFDVSRSLYKRQIRTNLLSSYESRVTCTRPTCISCR